VHFTKDEADIAEINRKQFVFEHLDKADIEDRLAMMHPDNMYVIYHSLEHSKLKATEPEVFIKESWFNKEFTVY